MNNLKKKEEAKPVEATPAPVVPEDVKLLAEIRDLLKKQ
jgi:large-conductance mechanosensitive channel